MKICYTNTCWKAVDEDLLFDYVFEDQLCAITRLTAVYRHLSSSLQERLQGILSSHTLTWIVALSS